MKSLQNLQANRIQNTENIKGAAGIFIDFSENVLNDNSESTSAHRPTHAGDKLYCDHFNDN
ncbi:hypothetical protein GQF61_05160 [Sphingobacterium sp. DK4209]|uniref:Uncharacterized protein n=1 Tax=Sphingobacterium zhuxiongii TaxID=2662364 RepID=A0A5Q0QEY0_9SPHI|nr:MULTISPECIES: hypothetical protein [unclassified Sphingobacterium]MVZ65233.1 hypothetical protein [Sphingobacterium sp. DK4209]QGA26328.1 hypothetical protein GFH32_08305 [Sphingobacterium sp. dk4302]